ncbi:MAG: FAD-binding oxidoreductase [SAR324 cluster bacterium]|nr:FAD-binding oxidoreductase [SAR324 cluster bacterium]
MIPRLNLQETLDRDYASFLQELIQSDFSGEIRTDYGSRLITSTDNSIYQIIPQAVVFPRSKEDILCLFKVSDQERFEQIKFSPRGGGTGTNGQSLSSGIIIDCSKYMNRILEKNIEEGWVRVEPGVVLDQLNEALRPFSVFFAPNLSPSNRATLGGMINTDACGQGSRIYGRTSNHVLELSCIFQDGTFWQSKEVDLSQLAEIKKRDDIVGRIYQEVDQIVTEKSELIEKQFPKMSRFLTGYNLAKVYPESRDRFNLNYLLSGSEGTLALICEAKLKLTPLPKYKQLMVVKYQSFNDALSDAQNLLQNDPVSIETIDEKILALAKEDTIYEHVKRFIADEEDATRAINLVEFVGDDLGKLEKNIQNLCSGIEKNKKRIHQAKGYYHTTKASEINHLWTLRKKGVGLLGNTKGERKPIPFLEDTAVPPENLAAYIAEFTAILEEHQLEYGMFGHVDVGCLHVRPALDMKEPKDEALIRELSDKIVHLVRKFGGVMWAEHGRGYRSEYTPLFFGKELYQDLRKVKEVFDPSNKLNPGKIVTPYSLDNQVVQIEAPLRGHYDRQIYPSFRSEFEESHYCNGNGACFNYDPDDVMCPSSKVTRDRIHSPKGRAGMMREWLRQLSMAQQGGSAPSVSLNLEKDSPRYKIGKWLRNFKKIQNSIARRKGNYDFSHEVHEAMKGCLACKACATQCPIHVDVPEFRSKFFSLYYSRYLRPLRDYLVAGVESMTPYQAHVANLNNKLLQWYPARILLQKVIGLCDVPEISMNSVKDALNQRYAPSVEFSKLASLMPEEKERSVILLQDVFTTFFEAKLVIDIYDLLRMLGFVVYLVPFQANGKPLHVKGFLNSFEALVKKNAADLEKLGSLQIPIIGIEPSIVLTYRDEYVKVLGDKNMDFEVLLIQEWLSAHLARFENLLSTQKQSPRKYKLLGHCTERTNALNSQKQWQQIYELFGLELELLTVGCCGMCGTFGHESEHYAESRGIYQMSWGKIISSEAKQRQSLLATGYSCRSQVDRFDHFKPLHPAQALLEELSHR